MKWLVILFLLIPTVAFGQQIDGKFIGGTIGASTLPNGLSCTPTAGQTLIGNAGGTAFACKSISADCSVDSTGAIHCNHYSQIGAGNNTYGNNSIYGINISLANESFPVAGKIVHLSSQHLAGTCTTTAPTFNVYVVHGGVETDGTAKAANLSVESITAGPTNQAENVAFVANDIIGIKIDSTSSPSGCNGANFDVDILVCLGAGC